MKNKILSIILSTIFCANIFGMQFTNNTKYNLRIAIRQTGDNEFDPQFIDSGKTDKVKPLQLPKGKILIGFNNSYLFEIDLPQNNVTITEDSNNFIITEIDKKPFKITKKTFFEDFEQMEEIENKDKDKSKFTFTLKKIIIAGGIASVLGYLFWDYKKTSKTTKSK